MERPSGTERRCAGYVPGRALLRSDNQFKRFSALVPPSLSIPRLTRPLCFFLSLSHFACLILSHPVGALLKADYDEVEALPSVRQPRSEVLEGAVTDVETGYISID